MELIENKEKALKEMGAFFTKKQNSHDGYTQEKAYWTIMDCMTLVAEAETATQFNVALRIYERWKNYL